MYNLVIINSPRLEELLVLKQTDLDHLSKETLLPAPVHTQQDIISQIENKEAVKYYHQSIQR